MVTITPISTEGLEEVLELNEQRNKLEERFKSLKHSLKGHKVMLNAKDGNWVEAEISGFYYNAKDYGQQVKASVKIDDPYYRDAFNALFDSDLWGYITLEKILEWNQNHNRGLDAEILFDDIKVGSFGHYKFKDRFMDIEITGLSKDDNGRLTVHAENRKKRGMFGLRKFERPKLKLGMDVTEYLDHQKLYRRENPNFDTVRGASFSEIH